MKEFTCRFLALILFVNLSLCANLAASADVSIDDASAPTDKQKSLVKDVETAVDNAERSIVSAEQKRRAAASKTELIRKYSSPQNPDDLALRDLDDLSRVVKGINDDTIISDLVGVEDDLTKEKDEKVRQALDNLKKEEKSEGQLATPKEVEATETRATRTITRIEKQIVEVKRTNQGLQEELSKVDERVRSFVGTLKRTLSGFGESLILTPNVTPDTATIERLVAALAENLPALQRTERLRRELTDRLNALAEPLITARKQGSNASGILAMNHPDHPVAIALKELDNEVVKWVSAAPKWMAALTTYTHRAATAYLSSAAEEPPDLKTQVQKDQDFIIKLENFLGSWRLLSAQLSGVKIADFVLDDARRLGSDLEEAKNRLVAGIARAEEVLGGNFDDFTEDQVSLFYFTNVVQLMKILNSSTREVGGLEGLREQAAEQRRKLTDAELALGDGQAQLGQAQRQLETLKEDLRQSRASLDSAETIFRGTSRVLKDKQDRLTKLEARLKTAQAAAGDNENDPQKQATVERLKERRNGLATESEEAERRNLDAKRDRDQANENYDNLKDDEAGLPHKISDAEDQLLLHRAEVNRQRKAAFLLTQLEADAFARARDNESFWLAPARHSSTDPAKRVLMYAFNNSKTIFLRGSEDDVARVKNIIAGFDRPAPQARLTLWTIELGSEPDEKGLASFGQALSTLEAEISNTRAMIAASVSFLRDTINRHVYEAAMNELETKMPAVHRRLANNAAEDNDLKELEDARYAFYEPGIEHYLQMKASAPTSTGTNPATKKPTTKKLREVLPDPSGTTTLGEALMVLSLARQSRGKGIMGEFSHKLGSALQGLKLSDVFYGKELISTMPNVPPDRWFSRTKRALGLDGYLEGTQGLTPPQREIARAIERWRVNQSEQEPAAARKAQGVSLARTITQQVEESNQSLNKIRADIKEAEALRKEASNKKSVEEKKLGVWPKPSALRGLDSQIEKFKLLDSQIEKFKLEEGEKNKRASEIVTRRAALTKELASQLEELSSWYNLPVDSRLLKAPEPDPELLLQTSKEMLKHLSKNNPLRTANARVAAADQMLKDIIIAFEDDLDVQFVQPMIIRLRQRLTRRRTGVQVGLIQRTSMLATNRLAARVDPRGSAQLAVGQEQNILQSVQQLAQLYLSAQTAGLFGVLGALDAQPRETKQEIYGINTGSTFQVTPIFDPSGQALRFKFDFVATTRVLEPDKSTNPQLPRIERHTVNTEVQISNLELREVSRFEANSRIGIPTQRKGGVPIVKDIPLLQDVPLLGWFVRKSGRAAVLQQSLIFAQTTIYPTIADIVDLLKNPVQ